MARGAGKTNRCAPPFKEPVVIIPTINNTKTKGVI